MKGLRLTFHCAVKWQINDLDSLIGQHHSSHWLLKKVDNVFFLTVWDCFVLYRMQQAHSQCLFERYMSQHTHLWKFHLCKFVKRLPWEENRGAAKYKSRDKSSSFLSSHTCSYIYISYFLWSVSRAEYNRHFLCCPSRFEMPLWFHLTGWHMSVATEEVWINVLHVICSRMAAWEKMLIRFPNNICNM